MTSKLLNPNIINKFPFANKGKRVVHKVTFNPSEANPGSKLKIELPLLDPGVVLEPNSFKLVFNLEVEMGEDKNRFVFNVSRNLVDDFSVIFGKHRICEIRRFDIYQGFHDLLQIDEDMELGVMSLAKRKYRAGSSDAVTKSSDPKSVKHCDAYGKTYHIPLNNPILDDYGCFYNRALNDKIEFELRLADKGDVVVTSDTTKTHSYKMTNIELEYVTIRNESLVNTVSSNYENGKNFLLEDIHLFKSLPINFATQKTFRTVINRSVRSMKGVLFLFTKTYAAGARDTEEFINPLISSVKATINGIPHNLYSDGIKSNNVWGDMLKKVEKVHKNFDEDDFHYEKYGLWIDTRISQDNSLHGDGILLGNIGGDMIIEITSVSVETSLNCFIFTVCDSEVYVENGRVTEYRL